MYRSTGRCEAVWYGTALKHSDSFVRSLVSHQLFLARILIQASVAECLFFVTGLLKRIRLEGLLVELVIRIMNNLESERILLSSGLRNVQKFVLLHFYSSGWLTTYARIFLHMCYSWCTHGSSVLLFNVFCFFLGRLR